MNHETSYNGLKHSSALNHNGQKKASADLSYQKNGNDVSGDFDITAPFMDETSGKMNLQSSSYPVTGHVELQMARHQGMSGDLSFSKTGHMDMEGSARLTAPWVGPLSLTASSKREGEDVLAKTILDLGLRQNYDLELRVRPESLALARVKLTTPSRDFQVFEAGYHVTGRPSEFDVNADLELQPQVGKYSGVLNWELDRDLSSKLRINTPHRDMRYVQLSVNSQNVQQGRKSRLALELFPRKTYAITNFMTTDVSASPLVFSLSAETPIPDFESFSLNLRHALSDSTINSHVELQYLPNRVVESTLAANWQYNVDGSITLKTPFNDFEDNKISLRHDGPWDNFNSHLEVEIMRETLTGDASFRSGSTTTGQVSAVSSIPALDGLKGSFKTQGQLDNFKGAASLEKGEQKIKGSVQHALDSRSLKTAASFNSPFTKNTKASIELSKRRNSVEAAVSGQYGSKKAEMSNVVKMSSPDLSVNSMVSYTLEDGPQEISLQMDKKGAWSDMQLTAAFASPFTHSATLSLMHNCNMPYNLKTTLATNYGTDYSIQSDYAFEKRGHDISASTSSSVKMGGPQRTASASFNKKGDVGDLSVTGNARYQDQQISVDGKLNTQNGIVGNMKINSPFENLEQVGLDLNHRPNSRGFQQSAAVEYQSGRKLQYSLDARYDGLNAVQVDGEVITPSAQKNTLKVRHNYDRYNKQCVGSAELRLPTLGRYSTTYKRVGDLDNIVVDLTLSAPQQNFGSHLERLPLTNGYKHAVEFTANGKKISANADYQRLNEKLQGKAFMSMSPQTSLAVEGDWSMSTLNAELNGKVISNYQDLSNTATISLKKSGPMNDVTLEMNGGLNSNKASAIAEFRNTAGDLSGKLDVQLPEKSAGASFKHSGNSNRFNTEASVHLDEDAIAGKATYYRYRYSRVEATAELTTPFSGFQSNKAEYRLASTDDSFTSTAFLEYGASKRISMDVKASKSPKYDMSVTLNSPWTPRKMMAAASMESLANTHKVSSSLDLGSEGRYEVDGSVDMDSTPMTMTGKLATPFSALRTVQISGSHQGRLDDFRSTFQFHSPRTDTIKADVMLQYSSPFQMTGTAGIASQLKGVKDLRVELKNSDLGSSKSAHAMVRYAPEEQIVVDGTWAHKDYWYNKQVEADLSLATPFSALRSGSVHVQHEEKNGKLTPKVEMIVNEQVLLDVEAQVMKGDNPSATLTASKPWPAQLTASLTRNGDQVDSELSLNWNRDESDKKVTVQAKVKDAKDTTDKDYSLKVSVASPKTFTVLIMSEVCYVKTF